MKIAIVFEIFYPTINGVITASVNLSENLVDLGHEVLFIAPKSPAFSETRIGERAIPVHYVQSSGNYVYPGLRTTLPWGRRLLPLLKREGVDIVHVTGPWLLTWAVVRAARKLSIPVVHTFHTMLHEASYILYATRTPLLVPIVQSLVWGYNGTYVKRSSVMTGPSRYVCRQLKAHFPDADVRQISNGIDLSRFSRFKDQEDLQRKYPWVKGKTLLYVGRMGQEKSIDQLVEAMSLVQREDPEAVLLLVGEGPNRKQYQRQVTRLGLGRTVFFLGRIPHRDLFKSGLIQHARAFVTASTTENQPMTVIESICCSTPVIVPDVEGINELLEDNGLLFEANNVSDLARKMVELLRDDEVYRKCRNATKGMTQRFDGRNVAREFVKLYREIS